MVKVFVIPRIKHLGERIEPALESSTHSSVDRIAAGHIKHLLLVCPMECVLHYLDSEK